MATLVRDTPVIAGKDAKRFRTELRKMYSTFSKTEKIAVEKENERIQKHYNLMVNISDGVFN